MDHEVQHHRQLQCWLMAEIQCGIWNWRAVRSNWLNWIKADFSDDYQQVYCWGKSFCQSNWIGSPTRKTWRITWMICVGSWNHCSLDEWIEINYLLYTILCYMYFLFFFFYVGHNRRPRAHAWPRLLLVDRNRINWNLFLEIICKQNQCLIKLKCVWSVLFSVCVCMAYNTDEHIYLTLCIFLRFRISIFVESVRSTMYVTETLGSRIFSYQIITIGAVGWEVEKHSTVFCSLESDVSFRMRSNLLPRK